MRLVETSHLKTWAGSKIAESEFPQIIKELICAVVEPQKLRMPSGDAVWVPGYDGILLCHESNRFVPDGCSVWEAGTNSDFRGKANSDYKKRSQESAKKEKGVHGVDRSDNTFVFVTPLVWPEKDKWEAERRNEGIWRDVRVIDGVDLTDWIEHAPAVALSFAARIRQVPQEGLQTLDQAWAEWSGRTEPVATEELVVAGRDQEEKELIGRLVELPTTFIVRGDSPREAWGFALAAIRRVKSEDERVNLRSRTIVADNQEVAGRLSNKQNLIIVLKEATDQVSRVLSSQGCHVVVPEGNDSFSNRNVIALGRASHVEFTEALQNMGLAREVAESKSRDCGLSITILQRQLAHANVRPPEWVNSDAVRCLMPALLAGRWNDRSPADREIICCLRGMKEYDEAVAQIGKYLSVNEPPLQRIGDMWTLVSPPDAFHLTARYWTCADLDRFSSAFVKVFGTLDPKAGKPPEEWIYQDLKGEQGHSGWLRSGMAETLLLISERGEDARLNCVTSGRNYAACVVHELPGIDDDWRLLASLRDQYPRLMEAAPDPLLSGLEQMLEAKPEDVCRLFLEGGGVLGGEARHTGLLWGLETLAWIPEYLPRVALILAQLASIDPGGRLQNRPINSLREIFLWWHPGTNASSEERLAVLDLMLDRQPAVGWDLLSDLLPVASQSVSHPTSKPRWRHLGDVPEDARTRRGQIQYMSAIVDRALQNVGTDPERWDAILKSLRVLNSDHKERALELLENVTQALVAETPKTRLWGILRDFANKHRAFQQAPWALGEDTLSRLEECVSRLTPRSLPESTKWLFDTWLPDLPGEGMDVKRQEADRLRDQAISSILQAEGIPGVVELGTRCRFPDFVASRAVSMLPGVESMYDLLKQAITTGERGVELAAYISRAAERKYGEEWRIMVTAEAKRGLWSPNVIASLLLYWPDTGKTWSMVEGLGDNVAREYWRRKPVYLVDGTPEERALEIDRLIEAGRATDAFCRIVYHMDSIQTECLLRLLDATLERFARVETDEEGRRLGVSSHNVREFLDNLRKRENVGRSELARREYRALPLLGHMEVKGLTLHDFMIEDPSFFVGVLSDAFYPSNRGREDGIQPSPEERGRAEAAFSLLHGLSKLPGQREDGAIDQSKLMDWIAGAREMATEASRAAVADIKIGELMAHAPRDPEDGSWPHRAVRNALEHYASKDIESGLMTGRFNLRGIVTKSVYEGGSQERELAQQYREWARASRIQWPRVAQVLDRMANGWEEDARCEDMRAEQQKFM